MKYIRKWLLITTCVFASLANAASKPRETAGEFVKWRLSIQGGGIPSNSKRLEARGIIAEDLIGAFKRANELEANCASDTPPDIVPPHMQGDIYSKEYENPDEAEIGHAESSGGGIEVPVRLIWIMKVLPQGDPGRVRTSQIKIKVVKNDNGWEVYDVIREDGGTLREMMMRWIRELESFKCPISQ